MKIVQFNNGKYGIRSFWFFGWRYYDLDTLCSCECGGITYESYSRGTKTRNVYDIYFHDCQRSDLNYVKRLYEFLKDRNQHVPFYKVVKVFSDQELEDQE